MWSVMGFVWGAARMPAMPDLTMKNVVRELRTELALSQGDLADKLEVSRQTINAIETGKLRPQPATRVRHRETVWQTDRKNLFSGEITMNRGSFFAGLALALSLLAPAFSAPAKFEAGALQVEQGSRRRARRSSSYPGWPAAPGCGTKTTAAAA